MKIRGTLSCLDLEGLSLTPPRKGWPRTEVLEARVHQCKTPETSPYSAATVGKPLEAEYTTGPPQMMSNKSVMFFFKNQQWELRIFILLFSLSKGLLIYIVAIDLCCNTSQRNHVLFWLSGLSAGLRTKGSLVQFPVRERVWVAGQVPSRGRVRQPHTDVSLPLFLLPFPSVKINK